MKQQEAVRESIGDYNFYIRPFPALTAANMTGDLAGLVTPLLGALAPLVGKQLSKEDGKVMDTEVEDVAPAIAGAFSSLTGDKLENLMKKLLVNSKNISYEGIDDEKPQVLTYDALNEIFCGNVQDMFILAFKVIKLNYSGFFGKLTSRFGSLAGLAEKLEKMQSEGTETST